MTTEQYTPPPGSQRMEDVQQLGQRVSQFDPDGQNMEVLETPQTDMELVDFQPPRFLDVWRISTGEQMQILGDHRNLTLSQRDENGMPIFSLQAVPPPKFDYMICRLHPNHAERMVWDRMALPPCSYDQLTDEYQLERHMRIKHPDPYVVIQKYEARVKEDEWRQRDDEWRQSSLNQTKALMDLASSMLTEKGHTHSYVKGATGGAPCQFEGCNHVKEAKVTSNEE